MNATLAMAIGTLPFYLVPLVYEFKKRGTTASTIFFTYSFLGTWLFCLLLSLEIISNDGVIAPWIVNPANLPWLEFAAINTLIFLIQLAHKRHRLTKIESISKDRLKRFTAFISCLTILYIFLTILAHGSIGSWIENSYRRSALENPIVNLLFPVATLTTTACIVLYTVARRESLGWQLRVSIYFTTALQLLIALASGGRSVLLLLVVSLLIAHGKPKAPKWILYSAVSLAIVSGSGLMIYARYQQQEAKASFDLNISNIIEASYTGLPYIDHFELARQYTQDFGHDYGSELLAIAVLPVPRALWEDKPIQLSRKMREAYWGDTSGGIPPGLFGEGFIGFGWIGVILISILYGMILRTFSSKYSLHNKSIRSISATAVLGSAIGFVLIRGGLDIGTYRVGMIFLFFFVCVSYLTKSENISRTEAR